jgi:chaperonin cofactor prefoldin
MEDDYKNMNVAELETALKIALVKLDDAEDELELIREKSNSGQHMGSQYIQSNGTRLSYEIESMKNTIEKIKTEIENRKEKLK